MSKQIELERLDRLIKDGHIRIHTVKANVDLLDKEINVLVSLEITLVDNLRCLKKRNIIASAVEFKKAKEDLAKTRARLIAQQNSRADFNKALDNVNQVIQESLEAIAKIKKDGENNVLQGNFGKKNDG